MNNVVSKFISTNLRNMLCSFSFVTNNKAPHVLKSINRSIF